MGYRFPIWFCWFARIFLFFYFATTTFLLLTMSNGYVLELKHFNICVRQLGVGAIISVVAGEILVGISVSFMFTRKLLMYTFVAHVDPMSIQDIAKLDEYTYDTLRRFTLLSIVGISVTIFSLVMASIFEVIEVWVSLDLMVNQTLILFMYKMHNKWYISCCGRMENCCVQPRHLKYFACNFFCFKINNIMNNMPPKQEVSEKDKTDLEMTDGNKKECDLSTNKSKTKKGLSTGGGGDGDRRSSIR